MFLFLFMLFFLLGQVYIYGCYGVDVLFYDSKFNNDCLHDSLVPGQLN